MAATVAEHTRDFARRFFLVIEQLGREDWLSANAAFERAVAEHPHHPYVAYIQANRVRKAGFSAAAERVREAEFPQIERRKAGTRKNAPVYYRVGHGDAGLSLTLPYEVPPSHPLRNATESAQSNPMRRDPEAAEARSPWRRRQERRVLPDLSADDGGWWERLTDGASELLDTVTRAISKEKS
jgi:hypothetical protein